MSGRAPARLRSALAVGGSGRMGEKLIPCGLRWVINIIYKRADDRPWP